MARTRSRLVISNVYVFRFEIQDGRIHRVDEYANPVTYALLAGLPIG